jgi:hypothetical protein
MVTIFDDGDRTDIEPASQLVSRGDYLNASARPEAARVRALVDACASRYPEQHRAELVRRIRSRDDCLHQASTLELILHELLVRRGCTIVAVEPKMPNGRSPDFLVEAPDGIRFYLEATHAWGEQGRDPGSNKRLRECLQAIDDVDSPDFFLGVHYHGRLSRPAAVARLRRTIQGFVDGLDRKAVIAQVARGGPRPRMDHDEHGLSLRIEAIPKNLPRRNERAIGVQMLPGGFITPHLAIRSAVEGKASRYGELELPFVVAVNAMEEFAGPDAAVDALFGTECVLIDSDGHHRWSRNPDGVWHGPRGPKHTRVSAVLATERLTPWNVGTRSLRLIHNPWAAVPLPDFSLGVDVARVVKDRLETTSGQPLRDLLGLPEGWPG